ncbi:MAG TPA: hypothetical protein VGH66_18975, partial [Acidimicrobiales bacterium]
MATLLVGAGLAACTSASANGTETLNYWSYPDNSTATDTAVKNCSAASNGRYKIVYNKLPTAADGQRQQLVLRMAAHDKTIDIMALDVTWEAEFSEAGWIVPWTGANKAAVINGTLPSM